MVVITKDGKVFLVLEEGKSYKRRRYLGYIEGDAFHCFRNPEKHLFRRMNAYGFCYELVRDGSFRNVVVHLPFGDALVTTRDRILRRGTILNYQSHLLEMQIFLRLEDFGKDNELVDGITGPRDPLPEFPSQMTPRPAHANEPEDEQPDLFGGAA